MLKYHGAVFCGFVQSANGTRKDAGAEPRTKRGWRRHSPARSDSWLGANFYEELRDAKSVKEFINSKGFRDVVEDAVQRILEKK